MIIVAILSIVVFLTTAQSNTHLWKNPLNILLGKISFSSFPYDQSEESLFQYKFNAYDYQFNRSFASPPIVLGGFMNIAINQNQPHKTIIFRYIGVYNTYARIRGFTDKVELIKVMFSFFIIDSAIPGITESSVRIRGQYNMNQAIAIQASNNQIPIVFIQGFISQQIPLSSNFQIRTTYVRMNSTHCSFVVSNTSIKVMRFYYAAVIIQKQTLLTSGIVMDYGWFRIEPSGIVSKSQTNLTTINQIFPTTTFMLTINSFRIYNNWTFNSTILNNFTLESQNVMNQYFNITYINFRSLCTDPQPFYYEDNISCVSACPVGFIKNSTHPWVCRCFSQNQYYIVSSQCMFCSAIFVGCLECFNSSQCKSCNIGGHFIKFQQRCVCKDGYYLNGTVCLPCEVSCITCVNSSTFCLTCNETNLRYFIDNRCDCVSVYSDCRNSSLPQCNHSQCSYLSKAQLSITSIIKNPSLNHLTVTMSISPFNDQFQYFNYYDLIKFGLPNLTQIQYAYSNGTFEISINYYDDLQDYPGILTLNLSKVPLWYFQLSPLVQFKYTVSPTNNLASNFYPQEIYDQYGTLLLVSKIVILIGFAVYALGLIISKLGSSQMLATIQISYFGLFILNHSDPLIQSLEFFKYTSGYNFITSTFEPNTPYRISSIGISSFIIFNLNFMIGLLLIPIIVSFIFYIIHLKSTRWKIRFQKVWKLILGEYTLIVFIFNLYNFSSSVGIFCLYTSFNSTWKFLVSLIQILLYLGMMGVVLWMYITKSKVWVGQFKSAFNSNKFSQLYYLIPIVFKFVIGLSLSLGNMHYISGIIVVLLLLSDIIIVTVRKPYIQTYHNVRSIIHNSISSLIMIVYIVLSVRGASKGHGLFTYFPYAIVVLVSVNILTGLLFQVYQFVEDRRKQKNKQTQFKQQEIEDSMRMDLFKEAVKAMNSHKSINNHARKRQT